MNKQHKLKTKLIKKKYRKGLVIERILYKDGKLVAIDLYNWDDDKAYFCEVVSSH